MELEELFEKVGLNQKEASVYLALLELGEASVESISKKAGTKRPTTYLILDSLQSKGLASIVPRSIKALYVAESPEKIINDLYHKQELVKRFLPNLLAIYNAKKDKPQVQLFEGKEGMRQVYEKIIAAKEIRFFATIRDVEELFPDVPEKLKIKSSKGEIKIKEILTMGHEDLKYAANTEHTEFYQHRFAKKDTQFLTDNVLFDDTVAFFSYSPKLFAVLIRSRDIFLSLRTLFELAWESADVINDEELNKYKNA
ncbi:MAG: hypothetical protein A3J48_02085 [Candidatus Doudnabacteria bacterium RIFCSPHIGHO2_02_FULL_46_11]|uniref:Transcription regulator TrmB N-terminal domain-containing protein n=1 Tax=Candidatus Doudnabacteria bacterium RIFCSPHIGHO2_02_FULL_46_11 TaxID=1817832 RepID=A0A1F5P5G8_9BACT|nr:MAG: hypothetical protein A3J48_02085 [Candidatus Doudnabacteria bacterium RIFCSPHIGHO2_02_FULL_46_11]